MLSHNIEEWRSHAAADRLAAEEAELENVRNKHLASAERWERLIQSLTRGDARGADFLRL